MEPQSHKAKEKYLLVSNTMTILNKHTMKDRGTSFNRYLPVHSMLKRYILIRTQSIMHISLFFFSSSCKHHAFLGNGKNIGFLYYKSNFF